MTENDDTLGYQRRICKEITQYYMLNIIRILIYFIPLLIFYDEHYTFSRIIPPSFSQSLLLLWNNKHINITSTPTLLTLHIGC